MADIHEETDILQFRDPNQPNLHLVYWTRGPLADKSSRALLVWNHGIGEHSGRYRPLAAKVLAAVPALDAIISYDMRSHGKSEGTRGAPRAIGDYVADLHDHVLPRVSMRYGADARVVLGGHSLGGAVIAGCACRPDCLMAEGYGCIKGVILSAPALEAFVRGTINRALEPFAGVLAKLPGARAMRKSSGIDPKALSQDPEVVKAYVEDELVYDSVSVGVATDCLTYGVRVMDRVKNDENILLNCVPSLVLHGTKDEVVKIEGSRKLVAAIQAKGKATSKLVEVEGAFHEVHNEKPEHGSTEFFDAVTEFLTAIYAA